MKYLSVFCLLSIIILSVTGTNAWAVDVGWMQKSVRVWYFGGVGVTTSSDAETAYTFTEVAGDSVQVTRHWGMNNWSSIGTPSTTTYSFLDMGPCWIHPQRLQNLRTGETWMGSVITLVTHATYTYDMLPYRLLPAKMLFDLKPQREIVKLSYMVAGFSTGNAYFDAETGLCLYYSQLNGTVTVFFVLSEINYDFATHKAFAEDNGPHTGFKSIVSEASLGWSIGNGGGTVVIQSSVEARYGNTVEMLVSTSATGPEGSFAPPFENYCFFGDIPVLRRMEMTIAPDYPPQEWNEFGQYLWWWVPQDALQQTAINVFEVPMTRTSTTPYTFISAAEPEGLFFSKLWFDNDGYLTAFSARDSTTGLDIDPAQTALSFENLTSVKGLEYYRETMGNATPVQVAYPGDVDGDHDVDLADAVYSLKIAAGMPLSQTIGGDADVNGDGKIGIAETIYILRDMAGL